MFIPKDEKPKDKVLNLTLFTFGVTAVVYMIWGNLRSGSPGLGPPTFNKLFYFLFHFSVLALACGFWLHFLAERNGGRGKNGPNNKVLKHPLQT